jgi:hypothetical protein
MPYKDKAKRIASAVASRRRRIAAMSPEERKAHYRSFVSRSPENRRKEHLKGRYGLSLEAWETLFETQGRRCAICGSEHPNWRRAWHTDHDHATGKIRGILCHTCNRTLGFMKDSRQQAQVFVDYLAGHSSEPTWNGPSWVC